MIIYYSFLYFKHTLTDATDGQPQPDSRLKQFVKKMDYL